jgi:hypothetical protein
LTARRARERDKGGNGQHPHSKSNPDEPIPGRLLRDFFSLGPTETHATLNPLQSTTALRSAGLAGSLSAAKPVFPDRLRGRRNGKNWYKAHGTDFFGTSGKIDKASLAAKVDQVQHDSWIPRLT